MKFDCPHCGKVIEARMMKAQRGSFDHDQALALLAFGATATEVAETFGVSVSAVTALKKRRDS